MPRHVAIAFPVPLRRTFTYAVPAELAENARAGCRAAAPLGGRTLSGVIVAEDPEVPAGVALRPVVAILDEEPALDAELLETTRLVAERFFASWGEMLRAALPAGLPPGRPTRWEATLAGTASASAAPPDERALLEMLLTRGPFLASELVTGAGIGVETIRRLEERGWIRAAGVAPRRARREILFTARADPEDRERLAGRSRRGREALDFLSALGRPASSEELSAAGFSSSVVRRLVDLGAVSRVESERRAEIPVLPAAAPPELTPDQAAALAPIRAAIASRTFSPFLLFGVTGSGKTEVYLRAIGEALDAGRGAVWLVPEIALTPVFARNLRGRFGERAVVLHSALGAAARAQAWREMRSGRARAVIGPRSAVFAPIADIGVFVVDEEHDGSYKQEESPRYDARDAAAIRAAAHGAALVLGSATPAIETWHASEAGKIRRLEMPARIDRRPLPRVEVVDLRGEPALPEEKGVPLFSRRLAAILGEAFARGEQAIVLAPRRGYAPFLLCRACGNAFPCAHCSVSGVVHRREGVLRCHYCGARRKIPAACDVCGGRHLEAIGAGTERAAERFAAIFPGVPYAVLDSDAARRAGGPASVVASMEHGRVQALIGTQMVAKGHHFPNVTAIGVLSADTLLNFPDFRSAEKTFQLVAQVAGRSGRGERPGIVAVQTFHPDNAAIRAALAHDAAGFARNEAEFRRTFFYPPFSEVAAILVTSTDRSKAAESAESIAVSLGADPDLRVAGSAPAPIERIAGRWRYQVLVRSRSRRAILGALGRAVPDSPAGAAVTVDVDPRNLM